MVLSHRRAGLQPAALPLSYQCKFGRPGVIRTLDLTRIRRALFLLSYWSLVAAPGFEPGNTCV
jgi:hypothetical protein